MIREVSVNLLVRIRCIIVMMRWTDPAPWEFGFPFPGSLTSTFLVSIIPCGKQMLDGLLPEPFWARREDGSLNPKP